MFFLGVSLVFLGNILVFWGVFGYYWLLLGMYLVSWLGNFLVCFFACFNRLVEDQFYLAHLSTAFQSCCIFHSALLYRDVERKMVC